MTSRSEGDLLAALLAVNHSSRNRVYNSIRRSPGLAELQIASDIGRKVMNVARKLTASVLLGSLLSIGVQMVCRGLDWECGASQPLSVPVSVVFVAWALFCIPGVVATLDVVLVWKIAVLLVKLWMVDLALVLFKGHNSVNSTSEELTKDIFLAGSTLVRVGIIVFALVRSSIPVVKKAIRLWHRRYNKHVTRRN